MEKACAIVQNTDCNCLDAMSPNIITKFAFGIGRATQDPKKHRLCDVDVNTKAILFTAGTHTKQE